MIKKITSSLIIRTRNNFRLMMIKAKMVRVGRGLVRDLNLEIGVIIRIVIRIIINGRGRVRRRGKYQH